MGFKTLISTGLNHHRYVIPDIGFRPEYSCLFSQAQG